MAYSNSSVAYDLSAYQPQQEKQKPELKVVGRGRRRAAAMINARAVSAFAIVVTLVSLMVYNQVQLNEVSGEINSLTTQLSKLESRNVEMMSELESTISLRTIGEQAKNELGMNRLDKYQTVYICMEQEDKIELTENSPTQSVGQRIQVTVTGLISQIQEYLAHD